MAPATMLTDYLLAGVALVLSRRLARLTPNAGWANLWAGGYLAIAAAGILGGTLHGSAGFPGEGLRQPVWVATGGLIVFGCLLLTLAVFTSRIIPPANLWLHSGLAMTLAALAALTLGWRPVPGLNEIDVYHVIQILGLGLIYRGASGVRHGGWRFQRRLLLTRLDRLRLLGRCA